MAEVVRSSAPYDFEWRNVIW